MPSAEFELANPSIEGPQRPHGYRDRLY